MCPPLSNIMLIRNLYSLSLGLKTVISVCINRGRSLTRFPNTVFTKQISSEMQCFSPIWTFFWHARNSDIEINTNNWTETLHFGWNLFSALVKTILGNRESNLPWFMHTLHRSLHMRMRIVIHEVVGTALLYISCMACMTYLAIVRFLMYILITDRETPRHRKVFIYIEVVWFFIALTVLMAVMRTTVQKLH